MARIVVILLLAVSLSSVLSKPLVQEKNSIDVPGEHKLVRRFINPSLTLGDFLDGGIPKMRTKRSEEECEKLQLCKLHAQSHRNFFAAFELYFVNKENARLWDHRSRSLADCEKRYGDCYDR